MKQILRAHTPNILATLCVVVLLLIANNQQAQAQCAGSCTEQWSIYMNQSVRLDNGCVLLVRYKVRYCSTTTSCQLYFDELTGLCCFEGQSLPALGALVRQVAERLYRTYYIHSCDEGFSEYRVKFPVCWRAGSGSSHYEGCITEPCCEVYGDPTNTAPSSKVSPTVTCTGPGCTYVCTP